MGDELNGYSLARNYWDFAFNNPELVKPVHAALYLFAVELCNRLGWKEKFGLPTISTMEALGLKTWRTYNATFNDLVAWGFFELVEKSKNQYTSAIIKLTNKPLNAYDLKSQAKEVPMTKKQRQKGEFAYDLKSKAQQDHSRITAGSQQDHSSHKQTIKNSINHLNHKNHINNDASKKNETDSDQKIEKIESPKVDSLHHRFVKIYYDFFEENFELKPNLNGGDFKAIKSIKNYLLSYEKNENQKEEKSSAKKEEKALQIWEYVLGHWHMLDTWHQGRTKPVQILQELQNILIQIKGKQPGGKNYTSSDMADWLAANDPDWHKY